MADTMTPPQALAALQDAIRAELIRELVEKLTAEFETNLGTEDVSYLDGFGDAIRTLETM